MKVPELMISPEGLAIQKSSAGRTFLAPYSEDVDAAAGSIAISNC
jgi:hypothetical protein